MKTRGGGGALGTRGVAAPGAPAVCVCVCVLLFRGRVLVQLSRFSLQSPCHPKPGFHPDARPPAEPTTKAPTPNPSACRPVGSRAWHRRCGHGVAFCLPAMLLRDAGAAVEHALI